MVISIMFLSMLMLIFELTMRHMRKANKIDADSIISSTKYKIQSITLRILLFILLITLSGFTAISFSVVNAMILIPCYLIIFFWGFEVW